MLSSSNFKLVIERFLEQADIYLCFKFYSRFMLRVSLEIVFEKLYSKLLLFGVVIFLRH